jgi:hypothetical protein
MKQMPAGVTHLLETPPNWTFVISMRELSGDPTKLSKWPLLKRDAGICNAGNSWKSVMFAVATLSDRGPISGSANMEERNRILIVGFDETGNVMTNLPICLEHVVDRALSSTARRTASPSYICLKLTVISSK